MFINNEIDFLSSSNVNGKHDGGRCWRRWRRVRRGRHVRRLPVGARAHVGRTAAAARAHRPAARSRLGWHALPVSSIATTPSAAPLTPPATATRRPSRQHGDLTTYPHAFYATGNTRTCAPAATPPSTHSRQKETNNAAAHHATFNQNRTRTAA